MAGPSTLISPALLGRELERIILQHSTEMKRAMVTAARLSVREVVFEIDRTPAAVRRTRGPSTGQAIPAPIDQGELKRSGKVDRTKTGAILEFTAPHAAHVELGTRPHTAPMAPLRAWAKRKTRALRPPPKPKKKGKKRKGKGNKVPSTGQQKKQRDPNLVKAAKERAKVRAKVRAKARAAQLAVFRAKAAEQLAKRAWLGIRKYGTEGRGFFARASQQFAGIVESEVRKRLAKIK